MITFPSKSSTEERITSSPARRAFLPSEPSADFTRAKSSSWARMVTGLNSACWPTRTYTPVTSSCFSSSVSGSVTVRSSTRTDCVGTRMPV
ncbi:Uncharacterised protein [Flavonifractor plautii]|uniref:Uncharacterized protein n=1 Tax=Flavonifractor plautii TaxID=292800 RepID=A0A174LJC7_FLAPL|nr:Uncharacterised protein [Flavonifractor plautii]